MTRLVAAAGFLALSVLAACGGHPTTAPRASVATTTSQPSVTVAHSMPDAAPSPSPRVRVGCPTPGHATPGDPAFCNTVRGQLVRVGGPAPGLPVPESRGTVTFIGPETRTVAVDARGHFHAVLRPGRYAVVGHSPLYDEGHGTCLTSGHDRMTHVVVVCSVR